MSGEVGYLFVCLPKALFLLTLQYLAFCDQIILLEDGKICEKGIHSELIQKKGRYAQLIQNMQGEATQVISNPPHTHCPCRGAPPAPYIHDMCFLPRTHCRTQQRQQKTLRCKGKPRPPSRKSLSMKMLVMVLDNRARTPVHLPGSSRGPSISSWTPDRVMSFTGQDPRPHDPSS